MHDASSSEVEVDGDVTNPVATQSSVIIVVLTGDQLFHASNVEHILPVAHGHVAVVNEVVKKPALGDSGTRTRCSPCSTARC